MAVDALFKARQQLGGSVEALQHCGCCVAPNNWIVVVTHPQ